LHHIILNFIYSYIFFTTVYFAQDEQNRIKKIPDDNPPHNLKNIYLSVTLCHSLQFILLLDSIRVTASLCSVDEFFSKTFSNGFYVSESSFTSADGKESDGLVDTSKR